MQCSMHNEKLSRIIGCHYNCSAQLKKHAIKLQEGQDIVTNCEQKSPTQNKHKRERCCKLVSFESKYSHQAQNNSIHAERQLNWQNIPEGVNIEDKNSRDNQYCKVCQGFLPETCLSHLLTNAKCQNVQDMSNKKKPCSKHKSSLIRTHEQKITKEGQIQPVLNQTWKEVIPDRILSRDVKNHQDDGDGLDQPKNINVQYLTKQFKQSYYDDREIQDGKIFLSFFLRQLLICLLFVHQISNNKLN